MNIVTPNTVTSGGQHPVNMLSDLLRSEMAFAGYTEILSFALVSYMIIFFKISKKSYLNLI